MDLSPEDRAIIALHLAPGIGPRTVRSILDRFGSPAAAMDASIEALCQIPYMKREAAASLKKAWTGGDVDAEIALMAKHGVTLLRKDRDDYPPSLKDLIGGPLLLFVRGQILPKDGEAIAMVGSRGCTSYGRRTAYRIAYDLAKSGYTIVSGLARGIDAEAHRGALDAGGRTIAVLANGLSRVYPPEHAELADRVAASGAVVSESCMRMEPLPGMFPVRNRIITGLSRAVVVVEAGDKSGALLSAKHAAEQGRDVFAVPGNVDSVASAGSMQLLRNGARMVRNARDVIEDLRGVAPLFETQPLPKPTLDGPSEEIWNRLEEPATIDDLCRATGIPMSRLGGLLMTMELAGFVRKQPGNIYERA